MRQALKKSCYLSLMQTVCAAEMWLRVVCAVRCVVHHKKYTRRGIPNHYFSMAIKDNINMRLALCVGINSRAVLCRSAAQRVWFSSRCRLTCYYRSPLTNQQSPSLLRPRRPCCRLAGWLRGSWLGWRAGCKSKASDRCMPPYVPIIIIIITHTLLRSALMYMQARKIKEPNGFSSRPCPKPSLLKPWKSQVFKFAWPLFADGN